MRTRDNSRSVTVVGTEADYGSDGALVGEHRSTKFSVVSPDVMTDVVTSGFKQRSARGEVIISPMSKLKGTVTVHPSNGLMVDTAGARYQWGGQWRVGRGFDPLTQPAVALAVDKMEALAITGAFAGVGSPDVAVLTELAELKETLSFLYSPVKGMVTLTKRFSRYLDIVKVMYEKDALRRAKWNKLPLHVQAKRTPPPPLKLPTFQVGKWKGTDVSSAWLAYRYGLMPLIYTFQDVQALLKKRVEGSPLRATSRSKEETYVDLTTTTDNVFNWHDLQYEHQYKVQGGCKVEARAGVLYEVDASLLTQLGVRWNRVPMAFYEAIPLSFVSDWFHNGADVYDALTAEARSGKILAAWCSTKVTYDLTLTSEYGPSLTPGTSATGFIGESIHGEWKGRRAAALSDVRLALRVDLSSKRVADGLALIHTFLSTGKIKK